VGSVGTFLHGSGMQKRPLGQLWGHFPGPAAPGEPECSPPRALLLSVYAGTHFPTVSSAWLASTCFGCPCSSVSQPTPGKQDKPKSSPDWPEARLLQEQRDLRLNSAAHNKRFGVLGMA